ncbi:MAG: hypothetical protein HQK54_15185 [Oligoflexales bacterium]|nr:hypothetical protein [Oligoflexales bacterium]
MRSEGAVHSKNSHDNNSAAGLPENEDDSVGAENFIEKKEEITDPEGSQIQSPGVIGSVIKSGAPQSSANNAPANITPAKKIEELEMISRLDWDGISFADDKDFQIVPKE